MPNVRDDDLHWYHYIIHPTCAAHRQPYRFSQFNNRTTSSKRFWRVGYLLIGTGWVTAICRKILWGILRGDGRRFQGGG